MWVDDGSTRVVLPCYHYDHPLRTTVEWIDIQYHLPLTITLDEILAQLPLYLTFS